MADNEDVYIKLDQETRSTLRRAIKSTGASPLRLLKGREDIPDGLSTEIISLACNASGKMDCIEHIHYDYILNICREYKEDAGIDDPQEAKYWIGKEKLPITDEYLETLNAEINRTGRSVENVLSLSSKKYKPSPIKVRNWLSRETGTALKEDMDLLLKEYGRYPGHLNPDNGKTQVLPQFLKKRKGYEPLREKDLDTIKRYRDMTGIIPSLVFKLRDGAPDGLNPATVKSWLYNNTRYARPEHVKWVIDNCRGLLLEVLED